MMYSTQFSFGRAFLSLLLIIVGFIANAQTVTGLVKDSESGETLIGATIIAVGSNVGAVTDIDGKFTIEAPEGTEKLRISYVGYQAVTKEIAGLSYIEIGLRNESLDEVIVIGYSTQKKSDKTGAVVAVEADELNQGRLADPIQAMQGKAAGVNVSKQGGDPN